MPLVVVLCICALVFGGVGVLVDGLLWLLVAGATVLLFSTLAGGITGRRA